MKQKDKTISVRNSSVSAIKLGNKLQNVVRNPFTVITKIPTQECPLVDDVIIQIAGHLSPPDVWPLTLVSRRYNALTTPILYSEIRLLWISDPLSTREDRQEKKRVCKSQKRLRETLAAHTHLMHHVKTLAWHLDILESVSDFIKFIAPMTRLQTLHIVRPYGSWISRSSMAGTPSILHPSCTRVIIEGLTTLQFVQHVIRPNQLKELTVDSASYRVIPILSWIATNSFPHLTTLCLRGPGGLWTTDAIETELVRNWTNLIVSLRDVLEEVTIGVRMSRPSPRSTSTKALRARPSPRKLIDILWPVFLQCEFPRLRTLTLTGVKIGNGESHLIPSQHMLEIRSVVPSVILVDDTPSSEKLWKPEYKKLEMLEVTERARHRPPILQHF